MQQQSKHISKTIILSNKPNTQFQQAIQTKKPKTNKQSNIQTQNTAISQHPSKQYQTQ